MHVHPAEQTCSLSTGSVGVRVLICAGLVAGVIMASLGSWFWQVQRALRRVMMGRYMQRDTDTHAALCSAGHSWQALPHWEPLLCTLQAYMHKRQFSRSSGKGAALREAGHSASDDEVWSRGGTR